MKPIRLILVAIENPGPQCHRLVAKAARLAHGLGADLELFHAVDVPLYVDRSDKLERIATRLRECGLHVGTAVEWGYPSTEAIIRRGAQIGADLIVAERQEGSHLARSLLRTTDWELVRRSSVPVLITATCTRAYRHPVVLAAVDPSRAHAKPAGLDEAILRASDVVNDALGGTLHVMHAYQPTPLVMPLEMLASHEVVADLETSAAAEAGRNLSRLLLLFGISSSCRHLVGGPSVKDALRSVVRSTGCSLVVMGAVVRDGIKGLFIGDTAEQVLDDLDCDVLVVKPRAQRESRSTECGRRIRGSTRLADTPSIARWLRLRMPASSR